MPRNISFSLTTDQIRNRTKTVTRRLGWKNLKGGEILNACVKCMGLKPGEKVERICQIRVLSAIPEVLAAIYFEHEGSYGNSEAAKEGFPELTGCEFVEMFCSNMGCDTDTTVTRIEFEYVEENEQCQSQPKNKKRKSRPSKNGAKHGKHPRTKDASKQ